jgi:hypothetical protein
MARNHMLILGAILAVLGVVGLLWQRIVYTEKETVVDVGAVKVTADKEKSIPISPIVGGVVLAGGVALIVMGMQKR